ASTTIVSLRLLRLRALRSTLSAYTTLFRSGSDRPRRSVRSRETAATVPCLYLHEMCHGPLQCELKAEQQDGSVPMRKTGRKSSRSEEHTSELQSPDHLVCRLLLEKKKL